MQLHNRCTKHAMFVCFDQVYHTISKALGFYDETTQWYKEKHPKCSVEEEGIKVLWNIPIHQVKPPENGANKPDIVIRNEKERHWLIIEGTVCNIREIENRDKLKKTTNMYIWEPR